MRKQFDEQTFDYLKNFIISIGAIVDNKCIYVALDDIDLTLCLNDEQRTICICEIKYQELSRFNTIDVFDLLMYKGLDYAKRPDMLKFYNKYIRELPCCDLNSNRIEV